MANGTLRALQLIETVSESEPFHIVLIPQCQGTVMTTEELMAVKVRWAHKAGYSVLASSVPKAFAPYNSVIRVSETGTEDQNRDYLAQIIGETLLAS